MNYEQKKADGQETSVCTNAPKMSENIGNKEKTQENNTLINVNVLSADTTQNPTKQPVEYSKFDGWMVLACYLCGYGFLWLINPFGLGMGVPVFTLCFCALALWYKKKSGPIPPKSWFWLALMIAAALPFGVWSNDGVLEFYNLIFLMICAVYWVSVLYETRLENCVGDLLATDLVNHFCRISFGNMGHGVGAVRKLGKGKKAQWKTLLPVAAAVAASVPILVLVLGDLSVADEAFAKLLKQLTANLTINENVWRILRRMALAVPVGLWFFGLFFGAVGKRYNPCLTAQYCRNQRDKGRKLSTAACAAVLILFCGVYTLFLAVQTMNLVQVLMQEQSASFGYSEYARQGFFELCRVTVINLVLLGIVRRFAARTQGKLSPVLRWLDVVLCLQTLVLIGTALGKMVLYIRVFGLTLLRVYTSWFMVLLIALFVILLVSSFCKICVHRWITGAFCALFLLLCWCNVGGIITGHNVERLQRGVDKTLDTNALYSISAAAAPQMRQLFNTTDDTEIRHQAQQVLLWAHDQSTCSWWNEPLDWAGCSLQSIRTKNIVESTVMPPNGSWSNRANS